MNKNLKLIKDSNGKMELSLIPMGDKIKIEVTGKVFCQSQNKELPKSFTYEKTDLIFNSIFGSKLQTKKFLKNNRKIKKVVLIGNIYSSCDIFK